MIRLLELKVDGQTVRVLAQSIQGKIWYHWRGQTYEIAEIAAGEASRSRARGPTRARGGDIRAPMPGKIIQVLAKEGATVADRQPLIVMEAMKMEYTLESASAGTIEKVLCKAGDQVQMGQELVKLAESKK
jgi:biotin carboxyl carrier protein